LNRFDPQQVAHDEIALPRRDACNSGIDVPNPTTTPTTTAGTPHRSANAEELSTSTSAERANSTRPSKHATTWTASTQADAAS
jgi:hypothetical protein